MRKRMTTDPFFFASASVLASALASFFAVSFPAMPVILGSASRSWPATPLIDLRHISTVQMQGMDHRSPSRDQTASPSAIPCTWRTEDRTRSTRAGTYTPMRLSGFNPSAYQPVRADLYGKRCRLKESAREYLGVGKVGFASCWVSS